VVPAYQRFDGQDQTRPQIDLRLVEQREFRTGERVSQFPLKQEFFVCA